VSEGVGFTGVGVVGVTGGEVLSLGSSAKATELKTRLRETIELTANLNFL
jgi:hypothetical protein